MPNILQVKLALRKQLQSQLLLSPSEAETETRLLLERVTGLNPSLQEIYAEKELNASEVSSLQSLVESRLQRIPLQHLLGEAYFFGLKFQVNSKVLIPRPETETLVEIALAELNPLPSLCSTFSMNKEDKYTFNILEIGTGSGCISVALARNLQNAQIIATDISPDCLEVAARNALLNGVSERISFEQADLVNDLHLTQTFDLLISNPPYIAESEFADLQDEVKLEPYLALVGHNNLDGLNYYRRIADLKLKAKIILLEIDSGRAEQIKEIFEQKGFGEVALLNDLNGQPRFLRCFNVEVN